jgi:hypothetical protein
MAYDAAETPDENNPISLKKLQKGKGEYSTTKCHLGFEFNCIAKTVQLKEKK